MSEQPHEALQRLIREQGRRKGWVADQIGVSPFWFSRYVQGKSPIPRNRAERLAELFGVEPELFTSLDD